MANFSFAGYLDSLSTVAQGMDVAVVEGVARLLQKVWEGGQQVFICGNGGSAANALHFANDLFYGVAKNTGFGVRAHALSGNQAIVSCLANDVSYDEIFSRQLAVLAQPGDLLIALSGSGNSPNIVQAIHAARAAGMTSVAILGYSGGKCKELADVALHFPVDDMQIAEDMQVIVGHMVMRWLRDNSPHQG